MKTVLSFRNERGVILITVYLVTTLLMILGAAFMGRVVHEGKISERDRHAVEALYIAEGALQQVLYDLRQDMVISNNWLDQNINGIILPAGTPNTTSWTTVPYTVTTMGDGTFSVELQAVTGATNAMRVRLTATSSGITRKLLINTQIINLNPWNNVLFAGAGQGGDVINGNVDIRGSIHILGDSLAPTDLAMDLSGGANIGNNYDGMENTLRGKLPNPPTVSFNGENVESLGAEVRIRKGKLGLSGTALAGSPDVPRNAVKETLNGVFINDGYGGNKKAENVNSDNGVANGYDAGNEVTFKTFSDPYKDGGTPYNSYTQFVTTKGLECPYNDFERGKKPDNFELASGTNRIKWKKSTGELEVDGVVYVNDTIDLGEKRETITYKGVGTMVALGSNADIKVHGNLLSKRTFVTDDTLALVAQDRVEVATDGGDTQSLVAGIFYGQTETRVDKQSHLAGVFHSKHYRMENVPSLFQVPSFNATNHPGLISNQNIYFMRVNSWQEIQ